MNPLFRLDILSEKSRYRDHPVGEKLLFSLGTLFLALIIRPVPFAILVSLAMMLFLIRSGVGLQDLAALLLLPSVFLLSALTPLFFELEPETTAVREGFFFSAAGFRFSPAGMHRAVEALLRAMAALLSIYSLTATTPMPRILAALRSLGMPEILLDILYFSHRMIHLFMDSARVIARAQSARGGDRSFRVRFRSRVVLLHRLYDRVRERVHRMEMALLSRGYNGELRFLSPPSARSTLQGLVQVILIQALLVTVSLLIPIASGAF